MTGWPIIYMKSLLLQDCPCYFTAAIPGSVAEFAVVAVCDWSILHPIHLDDVAIDFPDVPIIIAHPSWPWQDEALSVAMHKPNVYIDLSGWSPKYFPPQLVQYANTQLKNKILFGTDFPLITPERWMKDFESAGFKEEVKPLILKENATRLLKLE